MAISAAERALLKFPVERICHSLDVVKSARWLNADAEEAPRMCQAFLVEEMVALADPKPVKTRSPKTDRDGEA